MLAGTDVEARGTVEELSAHTALARTAAQDPIWKLAAILPGIGSNFGAISEVAISAHDVTQGAVRPLVNVSRSLDWDTLKPENGRFNIGPLESASPALVSAANKLEVTHSRLRDVDRSGLLPQVVEPLNEATRDVEELLGSLTLAANASKIVPTMLGATEARNYLVLVQNNAEIRATGGLPGALAVLRAEGGTIKLTAQASGASMGKFDPPIAVDSDQTAIFTKRLGTYISDVNLTPDFPTAAKTAKAMWEKRYGTRIDGVVAIDPVVLSHILRVSGPLDMTSEGNSTNATVLPDHLSAENVVKTLLSDSYARIDDNELQDAYYATVSRLVFDSITSGKASGAALLNALAKSAEEDRLLIWSDHPDEQDVLARTPTGGSVSAATVTGATFGVYFNDGTGAKMDFYVKRTVQLVEECTGGDSKRIKVRVTLLNTAPMNAAVTLPESVTGGGRFGVPSGAVQTNVVVYGPPQSAIDKTFKDGIKASFAAQTDRERPVATLTLQLKPGQKSTVEFNFGGIVHQGDPVLHVTPTVQPVEDVIRAPKVVECVAR
ncbi:DUF4012 domain-containing protein [Arthrobacter sp. D1-17]